jgi:hypothetical protein
LLKLVVLDLTAIELDDNCSDQNTEEVLEKESTRVYSVSDYREHEWGTFSNWSGSSIVTGNSKCVCQVIGAVLDGQQQAFAY